MKYELRQLQSCAANSIENLVKHNTRINLIIAMQKNGLTAYIALDHENENTALDSSRQLLTLRCTCDLAFASNALRNAPEACLTVCLSLLLWVLEKSDTLLHREMA